MCLCVPICVHTAWTSEDGAGNGGYVLKNNNKQKQRNCLITIDYSNKC